MGGILDTLTRPSASVDLLAGSMGWLMLRRGDCRRSFPRCFSFSPIRPSAVRLPSLLASGPARRAEGTISESPHSEIQTSPRRNDRLQCARDILRLQLLRVVFECWRRCHRTSDGKTPTYIYKHKWLHSSNIQTVKIATAIQTFDLLK